MRPVLVSLGPWGPQTIPVIIVVVIMLAVAWRALQRRLGEKVAPLNAWTAMGIGAGVLMVSLAVYLLVNRFAPVEIKSYGTMLVLAFAAAICWMAYTTPRQDMTLADIFDFALFVLVGSIVGARLVFYLMNLGSYASSPGAVLRIWEGGLSFHGGVIGAMAAVTLYTSLRRKRFWRLADLAAPAIALGYSITRIGCFLNGCCYGIPTHSHWGVYFPAADSVPILRLPAQLYASAANALIFGMLAFLARKPRPRGQLFCAYLLLYSVYRFLIEIVRRGATAVVFKPLAPLTDGQVASLAIILLSAIALIVIHLRSSQAQS